MPTLIVVSIILFVVFMKSHSRHKKPVRAAIANMIMGVVTLVLVAPVISAAVNMYTVFTSLTLGVPGTILVLLGTIFI